MAAALCLAAAVGGAVLATVPADRFELRWTHSVERIEWRESWRISGDRLELVEAAVQGSGAGMDPPEGARRVGAWWVYRPRLDPLDRITLANSEFTADYTLCTERECRALADLIGGGHEAVALFTCSE